MSLYDDIELPPPSSSPKKHEDDDDDIQEIKPIKTEDKPTSIAPSNLSFLRAQLESKKAQIQSKLKIATPSAPSHARTGFTPSALLSADDQTAPVKKPTTSRLNLKRVQPLKIDASTTFSVVPKAMKEDKVFLFNEIVVEDEYNPTAPTDYHSFKAKREAQRAKERIAREIAERLEREHAEEIAKRGMGANIAPPTELLESEPVMKREPSPEVEEIIPKKDVVSNIMSRMGYRQGFGLGKTEQGISTALQVKKVGKATAVIVDTSREFSDVAASSSAEVQPPINITELLKNASKIVLVKNMVLPSDVDAELKNEITEEMTKYGQISNVIIHLMNGAPEDESVRIFVEFTNQAQAIKAVIDLNKRFFNGRAIRATFYSPDYFTAQIYDR